MKLLISSRIINEEIESMVKHMKRLESSNGTYLFGFNKDPNVLQYLWLKTSDEKALDKAAKVLVKENSLFGIEKVFAVKPYDGLPKAFSEAHYRGWYFGTDSSIGVKFLNECSEHGLKIFEEAEIDE